MHVFYTLLEVSMNSLMWAAHWGGDMPPPLHCSDTLGNQQCRKNLFLSPTTTLVAAVTA